MGLFLWAVIIHTKRHGPAVLVKAVLLGIIFFAFSPAGYSDRLHSISDTSKDETGSANARWVGMVRAAQLSVEHPFGVGLKMHNILLNDRSTGVHSAFLEVAADLGIMGGILFAVFFIRLIFAMQAIRDSPTSCGGMKPLAEASEVSQRLAWSPLVCQGCFSRLHILRRSIFWLALR
jgi:O-antigen ligase